MLTHPTLPCGWCGTANRDATRTNCVNCGGPLPALPSLPGEDPGEPPPPVPRVIPSAYQWRVLLWKNVLVSIGIIFTVPFFWTIIFPLIGIPLWVVGYRKARSQLDALERGLPVRAELVDVERDTSIKMNGRSPWRLTYTFETPQGVQEGWVHAWEAAHGRRRPGEALWVVYMPDDPTHNTPWPPIR